MISNFEQVDESLKTMEGAMGSAADEFERATDSIEFKANRLRATMFQMWQDAIDREGIKTFIDSMTVIAGVFGKFVEIFGLIPPIIAVATIALVKFNATAKASATILMNYAMQGKILTGVKVALTTATKGLNIALIATRVAATALMATLTLGLSIAIQLIITGIMRLINSSKEYIQSLDTKIQKSRELQSTLKQEKSELQGLADEYNELLKILHPTVEQKRRLAELNEQIQKTYPALITFIDTEGKLGNITADAIKRQNDELRENIRLEAEREKRLLRQQARTEGEDVKPGIFATIETDEFGNIIYDEKTQDKFDTLIDTFGKFQQKVIESEKDISDFAKSAAHFVSDQFLASLIDDFKTGKITIDEMMDKWQELVSTLASPEVEEARKAFEKAIKSGDPTEITKQYENFEEVMSNATNTIFDMEERFDSLDNVIREAMGFTNIQIKSITESTEGLRSVFEDTSKDIEQLDNTIRDLEEGKLLDGKATSDLLLKYPQLKKSITENADGYTIEISALEKLRKTREEAMRDALKAEFEITKATEENLRRRLAAYKIDLSAIQTLADARDAGAGIIHGFLTDDIVYDYKVKREQIELRKSLFNYAKAIEHIEKLMGTVSKTSSDSASSAVRAFEGLLDIFYKLQRAIDNVNSALARNRAEYQRANPERRAQLIAEENKLLREQQINYANLAKATREQASANVARLRDMGVTIEWDAQLGRFSADAEQINNLSNETRETVMKLVDETASWASEIQNLSAGWWDLEQQLKGTYDALRPLDRELSRLQFRFDMLEDSDFDDKLDTIHKMLDVSAQKVREAERAITEYVNATSEADRSTELFKQTLQELEEQYFNASREYQGYVSTLRDLNETITDERLKSITDVERKIQDILKRSVDEEKRRLDEKLRNYRDYINERINLLRDEWSEEDYQRELARQQEKILEIERKKDILALDDSFEARARVASLEEELLQEREKLEDMQRRRSREEQEKSLRKNLEEEEKAHKERINYLDDEYSHEQIVAKSVEILKRGSFDTTKEIANLTRGLLGDIELDIGSVHKTFEEKFGQGLSTMGKTIQDEFVSQLEKAIQALKEMPKLIKEANKAFDESEIVGFREHLEPEHHVYWDPRTGQVYVDGKQTDMSGLTYDHETQRHVGTRQQIEETVSGAQLTKPRVLDDSKQVEFRPTVKKFIHDAKIDWSREKGVTVNEVPVDTSGMEVINGTTMGAERQIVEALRNAGLNVAGFAGEGFTGTWSGRHGRLAMVHPEEFILNKDTVSNMLQGNLSKILPQSNMQNISNNVGNVEFKFDNLIHVEGNVTKDTLPKLETLVNQAGDKIINKLNQARNKRGQHRDLRFNN